MGSGSISACFLLFFLHSLIPAAVAAQNGGGGAAGGRQLWCVAKNNAEDAALQSALDWCCGYGGADCGPIQNGGPCYDGSDLQRTASFAFNDYYHKHGPGDDSCNFGNTAALTSINPSFHNCKFPSSISSSNNGNFSGPVTTGMDGTADLSSSGTRAWGLSFGIPLIFAVLLIENLARY